MKINFRGLFRAMLIALMLFTTGCELVPAPQITQGPVPASSTPPTDTAAATATTAPASPAATSTLEPTSTSAPAFPDPSAYDWTPFASGLTQPVDIQNAGDGSGRLFVVEKAGRILIIQNGQVSNEPFLDIQGEVNSGSSERGLLGLAFHPNYSQSGLFFVNYIDQNGNTVIARFHLSTDDPNKADPSSEVDLIHVNQPYPNHNGGGLAFGPDGYLYIGLGDGGSGGDPMRNGQNLQTMLGKLLRIDVDKGDNYSIPADNPFAGGGGLGEIWAYGLRNPWRFSFDRTTGDLYIADVGQDSWEEVNFVPAGTMGGLNFGWSYFEGNHSYNDTPPANASFIQPAVEYSHSEGCSVTGGSVYRGQAMSEWQGVYLYGDYCSGSIWGLIHTGQNEYQSMLLFQTGAQITTFGVDEAGEIYMADFRSGSIVRLTKNP